MNTYIIHIKSSPAPGSTFSRDIQEAIAIVYATAKTYKEAETKAKTYIMDHHWLSKEISFSCKLQEDEIDGLDNLEHYLYEKSARREVAVFFSARRKSGHAPQEFRAITPLANTGNTRH